MLLTRSHMLAALVGMSVSPLYAAPHQSAGAAKAPPVAPKPVAPKPAEVKAANVIETGKPIPEGAAAGAVVTGEAAKLVAARKLYDVEDNIPLPEKRIGVKGESIYPFATIGINQSFFVAATDTIKEPWKTLTSMASRMSRDLYPKKFITARQTKDGKEGVRIWRASDATEPLAPPRKKAPKAAPAAQEAEQVQEAETETQTAE